MERRSTPLNFGHFSEKMIRFSEKEMLQERIVAWSRSGLRVSSLSIS
jgi:hypothetical protein